MLPLPGAPSSSWAMYRQRIMDTLRGSQARIAAAFFLFGLLNNVFGVIILSAALDLVGPHIPKGTVLLATTLPGVCTKVVLPYVIHVVPYSSRIVVFSAMSTVGMLLVALTPTYSSNLGSSGSADFGLAVGVKILGIIIASLSSGAGELSFLGLTHYYGSTGLAAWGSGTGAAGLVGAGAYAFITGPLGVGVRQTLLGSAIWPFGMAVAYFFVLPLGPLKLAYPSRSTSRAPSIRAEHFNDPQTRPREEEGGGDSDEARTLCDYGGEETDAMARSDQGLLSGSTNNLRRLESHTGGESTGLLLSSFGANLRRARSLFLPFMLPLFIVYVGEYTINQGVTPTLLFELGTPAAGPFRRYREFYPAYATIYQLGVFISRSSIFLPSLRLHALYPPALLQLANLGLLVAQAVHLFMPSVWPVFLVIFWEGLLGGAVYVNTFAKILDHVPPEDREFSLSATSVSDSTGILLASFLSMKLEVSLCSYQVAHGRDYCNRL